MNPRKTLRYASGISAKIAKLEAMVARKMGGQVAKASNLSGKRRTTTNRLPRSAHAVVPAMITMQASMEEIMHRRQSLFVLTGEQILVSAYVVKAAAQVLEEHRILDSFLKTDTVPAHGGTNVAVAISTPDGLVAPVVSETNGKSVAELSREIQHLTDCAMKSSLTASCLGETFAVVNLAAYDVELFFPTIRLPHRVVLGFSQISDKAIVIRKEVRRAATTTLSLVFDDRVLDCLRAAQFLQGVKDLLEDPGKLH